jgi:hypothetical protein
MRTEHEEQRDDPLPRRGQRIDARSQVKSRCPSAVPSAAFGGVNSATDNRSPPASTRSVTLLSIGFLSEVGQPIPHGHGMIWQASISPRSTAYANQS